MNQSSTKGILQNLGWLSGEQTFKMIIALPVSILVARYLGPDNVGILGYAVAMVGLFMPLAMTGLSGIVVRDLVKESSSTEETLGSAFIVQLCGSIVVMILALGVTVILQPNQWVTQLIVVIMAGKNIFTAFNVIDYWFQSKVQSKQVSSYRMIATLIVAGSKLILIWIQASLLLFALVFIVESVIIALFLSLAYRKHVGSLRAWKASKARVKELLYESWPLTISGLAIMVQAYVDQVMLGQMLGNNSVGQYSVAIKLIGFVAFLPTIMQRSWAPSVAQAKREGQDAYLLRLSQLYQLMFGIFLLQGIPMFFLASPIVSVLYGAPFDEAGALLSLLAIRLLFANYGLARNVYITNESMFVHSLLSAIAGSVVNVAANYLLIPIWGARGAIIATIISFTITVFVMDMLFAKTRENFFLMIRSPKLAISNGWRLIASRAAV